MATNGTTVHVSFPKELHAAAKALAESQHRTIASVILQAVEAFLKSNK